MPFVSSPRVPIYRITLFYGPESIPGVPQTLQCVFNVKKRSWKGGVQIVVGIEEAQLATAKKLLQLDYWVEENIVRRTQGRAFRLCSPGTRSIRSASLPSQASIGDSTGNSPRKQHIG